jgi:hypothetical protein
MVITRHAPAFFKFQLGDLTVALNPPSKKSSIKASRFGADIVLQSQLHEDFGGGEDLNLGGKNPIVIDGPGEYEIKNIIIRGLPGVSTYGGKESINTIYTLNMDNMKICVLGLQSVSTLLPETKSAIDEVDILFIGSGDGILASSDAYKLSVSLEPRLIVPFAFNDGDLKLFLKEAGSDEKAEEKLTLKKKDLEGKEGDIMSIKIT